MRQGDIGTELIFTVVDENGNPVNLESAASVNLIMSLRGNRVIRPCEIIDAVNGRVKYIVQENDLEESGTLNMEIRVEFVDGDMFTSNRITEVIEAIL